MNYGVFIGDAQPSIAALLGRVGSVGHATTTKPYTHAPTHAHTILDIFFFNSSVYVSV